MTTLEVGDEAPDFVLPDDAGQEIRLADLRGQPVVLFFYPKDDTPGCTKEACGFRDSFKGFEDADAIVLGVSPDPVESHRKFRKKHSLPFQLLVDEGGAVAKRFDAWGVKKFYGREYEGVLRSTFVIDAEGRVARVFRSVRPEGHSEEVLAAAREVAGAPASP